MRPVHPYFTKTKIIPADRGVKEEIYHDQQ